MSLDTFSRYKDNDLDLEPQEEEEESLAEQAILEPSFPEIEEDLDKEEHDEDYDSENSSYETPEDKDEPESVQHIGSGTSGPSSTIPNPLNQSIYSKSSLVTTAPNASPAPSFAQPTLSVPPSVAATAASSAGQPSETADVSSAPVSPKIPGGNGSMDAVPSEKNDLVPEKHSLDKENLSSEKVSPSIPSSSSAVGSSSRDASSVSSEKASASAPSILGALAAGSSDPTLALLQQVLTMRLGSISDELSQRVAASVSTALITSLTNYQTEYVSKSKSDLISFSEEWKKSLVELVANSVKKDVLPPLLDEVSRQMEEKTSSLMSSLDDFQTILAENKSTLQAFNQSIQQNKNIAGDFSKIRQEANQFMKDDTDKLLSHFKSLLNESLADITNKSSQFIAKNIERSFNKFGKAYGLSTSKNWIFSFMFNPLTFLSLANLILLLVIAVKVFF